MTDPAGPALPEDRAGDPLVRLRRDLEEIDAVPVADRVGRFERANELIVRELAQLDEV